MFSTHQILLALLIDRPYTEQVYMFKSVDLKVSQEFQ